MPIVTIIPPPPASTAVVSSAAQISTGLLNSTFALYSQLYNLVWAGPETLTAQNIMDAIEQNNPGQSNPAAIMNLLNDTQTFLANNYPGFVLSVTPGDITINQNGTVTITNLKPVPPITVKSKSKPVTAMKPMPHMVKVSVKKSKRGVLLIAAACGTAAAAAGSYWLWGEKLIQLILR